MSNLNFIEQNVKNICITKSGTKLDALKKLTHLYLHDKYLQSIGNLSVCENLHVLYLHNNELKEISNLESLSTLKHLYLQKNQISRIEGLDSLRNLRKLYLACNLISVIEGLNKLINLEELHVEKQRLNKGESLCFDPRSILNLAETLLILNISHNNISSIESLEPLRRLRNLNASYNKLADIESVAKVVHSWYNLTEINFIGNPMTKQHRYKDILIANTFRLVILDNKDINETTRSFIKRFEFEKSQNRLHSASKINVPKNIPGSVPPTLQKSIMKNMSHTLIATNMSEGNDVYLPWQALKPSVSDSGKVIPPLFVTHQLRRKSARKKVHFATFPELP